MIKMSMLLKNKSSLSMLALDRFKLLGNIKPMLGIAKLLGYIIGGIHFPILLQLTVHKFERIWGTAKRTTQVGLSDLTTGWLTGAEGKGQGLPEVFSVSMRIKSPFRFLRKSPDWEFGVYISNSGLHV